MFFKMIVWNDLLFCLRWLDVSDSILPNLWKVALVLSHITQLTFPFI